MASIGILGGTFNPPHLAHVECARAARDELGLHRVLLVPAAQAPHKTDVEDPGPVHRLSMCRLAVAGEDEIAVCTLELDRGGPSYTAATLRELHASEPADQLTLIVGADMARTLPSWREPEAILTLATLAVAERGAGGREAVSACVGRLAEPGRVRFLALAPMPVSSSLVRRRVAAGEPVDDLISGSVADYIERHSLYRETSP